MRPCSVYSTRRWPQRSPRRRLPLPGERRALVELAIGVALLVSAVAAGLITGLSLAARGWAP